MPTVPQYNTPQVNQTALPGARQSSVASPSLLGHTAEQQMETGKSLLVSGTGVSNAGMHLQERENADMLFRAESTLKDDYLKHEQSVRERRGQSAWGVTNETDKWFADQEKEHGKILTNDAQRYLFGHTVNRLRQQAVGAVGQYESGERRRSVEESARASIVGSINIAAAGAADGFASGINPVPGAKADIIKRVQVLSDLNGWDSERRQQEEAAHITNLHKQVLQSLADKDPKAASDYFQANKGEINGVDHDQINKFLKIGGAKQAAFEFAEDPKVKKLGESAAVALAREKFANDPDKREAAVMEVKTRFAERDAMRERAQRSAADQAWNRYSGTGKITEVPSHILASMDGRDRETLMEHAQNRAAGKGVTTDFGTWSEVRGKILSGQKVDLRQHINKLSPSDLQELEKLQHGDPSKIKEAATLSQQQAIMHNHLNWGSGNRESKGAYDKATNDAINADQAMRGKELNYDERQAILDRMAIEGDINGMWPGGYRKLYEVQGKPEAAEFVPTVPAVERTKIEAALTRAGKPVTDTEVMRLFKQKYGIK